MSLAVESFSETMRSWGSWIDATLDRRLGEGLAWPPRLREAMRYSLFAGGKRLRPMLVLLATDACLASVDLALPAACAVELVHTYSLIHDDLPAMDDDALRRGRPTCHRQFDEATAILAGDALLTFAFELLAEVQPPATALRCVRELARAAGAGGMVGGQYDDLHAEQGPATLEWLEALHARKTGDLLLASLRMGGYIAGATAAQLEALDGYGRAVGLAFQVADDLLDVEGDAVKLGKDVHKDLAAGKLTYPGLIGVEASHARARELVLQAKEALRPFGDAGQWLAQLADYIVERDR